MLVAMEELKCKRMGDRNTVDMISNLSNLKSQERCAKNARLLLSAPTHDDDDGGGERERESEEMLDAHHLILGIWRLASASDDRCWLLLSWCLVLVLVLVAGGTDPTDN